MTGPRIGGAPGGAAPLSRTEADSMAAAAAEASARRKREAWLRALQWASSPDWLLRSTEGEAPGRSAIEGGGRGAAEPTVRAPAHQRGLDRCGPPAPGVGGPEAGPATDTRLARAPEHRDGARGPRRSAPPGRATARRAADVAAANPAPPAAGAMGASGASAPATTGPVGPALLREDAGRGAWPARGSIAEHTPALPAQGRPGPAGPELGAPPLGVSAQPAPSAAAPPPAVAADRGPTRAATPTNLASGAWSTSAGARVSASSGRLEPAIRVHAEWSDDGVRIWLGLSRQVAGLVPQLVTLLVHQFTVLRGPGGGRLLGIVCNGEEAWSSGSAAPPSGRGRPAAVAGRQAERPTTQSEASTRRSTEEIT